MPQKRGKRNQGQRLPSPPAPVPAPKPHWTLGPVGIVLALLGGIGGVAQIAESLRSWNFWLLLIGVLSVCCVGAFWKYGRHVKWRAITLVAVCVVLLGLGGWAYLAKKPTPTKITTSDPKEFQVPDHAGLIGICKFVGDDPDNVRIVEGFLDAFKSKEVDQELLRAVYVEQSIRQTDSNEKIIALMDSLDCFGLIYGEYARTPSSVRLRVTLATRFVKYIDGKLKESARSESLVATFDRELFDSFTVQNKLGDAMVAAAAIAAFKNFAVLKNDDGVAAIGEMILLAADKGAYSKEVADTIHQIEQSVTAANYALGNYRKVISFAESILEREKDFDRRAQPLMLKSMAEVKTGKFKSGFQGLAWMLMNAPGEPRGTPAVGLPELVEKENVGPSTILLEALDDRTLVVLEENRTPMVLRRMPSGQIIGFRFVNARNSLLPLKDLAPDFRKSIYDEVMRLAAEIGVPPGEEGMFVDVKLPIGQ